MDKYRVVLMEKARQDLADIYSYIADMLIEPGTAENMLDSLEQGILSLEQMPYRCPERRRGVYAGKGYHQLFVKNYTVIFRVEEAQKMVLIVTIRYSRSEF